jgi:[ribosomal protein S18]-alanine N-acetyltransferase
MLIIRRVRQEDLSALIRMEREARTAAHWKESDYEMLLASEVTPLRITLVAEKDDRPVGFIVARIVGMDWEIENIVVRADSQRQGIGGQLISRLLEEAQDRGVKQILLEVRSRNTAAKGLYAKCGFSVVGGRRGYYRDPDDDAVLYELELSKIKG